MDDFCAFCTLHAVVLVIGSSEVYGGEGVHFWFQNLAKIQILRNKTIHFKRFRYNIYSCLFTNSSVF